MEKTTQVTEKLYRHNVVHLALSGIRTPSISGDRQLLFIWGLL